MRSCRHLYALWGVWPGARGRWGGRRLAGHYGFTAEELDFILNYDSKCRHRRGTKTEA